MEHLGLYRFNRQIVRDLAWVIGSPPLLQNSAQLNSINFIENDFFLHQFLIFKKQLNRLEKNPSALNSFLEKNNTRLIGKYFERLIEFWLLHRDDIRLIDSNIQINSGNKTLGEFDFIYKDLTSGQFIHLEVAGKFYLARHNSSEWCNFIGPNGIDNLRIKLNKIINDQIPLGKNNVAQHVLFNLGVKNELISGVILKGYLFYNLKHFKENDYVMPDCAEPSHLKGWWLSENEIGLLNTFSGSKWKIIERKNWVSRVYSCKDEKFLDIKTLILKLKKYFSTNRYPLLIAELDYTDNNCLFEKSRGFVVSDTWPNDERKN